MANRDVVLFAYLQIQVKLDVIGKGRQPQTQGDSHGSVHLPDPEIDGQNNLEFFKDKGHRIMLVAATPVVTLALFAASSILISRFDPVYPERFSMGLGTFSLLFLLSLLWLAAVAILFKAVSSFNWTERFPKGNKRSADRAFLLGFDIPMLLVLLSAALYFYYATDSYEHPVLIGLYALIVWSASTTASSLWTLLGTNIMGIGLPLLLVAFFPLIAGHDLPGRMDWASILEAFGVLYLGLYFPWILDQAFRSIQWVLAAMDDLLKFGSSK